MNEWIMRDDVLLDDELKMRDEWLDGSINEYD